MHRRFPAIFTKAFAIELIVLVRESTFGALVPTLPFAWHRRQRKGRELLMQLPGPAFSHWGQLAGLASLAVVFCAADLSFGLSRIPHDHVVLATLTVSALAVLWWALILSKPVEIRALGIQVGHLFIYWSDVERYTLAPNFLALEGVSGTASWMRIPIPIDSATTSQLVTLMERLVPGKSLSGINPA